MLFLFEVFASYSFYFRFISFSFCFRCENKGKNTFSHRSENNFSSVSLNFVSKQKLRRTLPQTRFLWPCAGIFTTSLQHCLPIYIFQIINITNYKQERHWRWNILHVYEFCATIYRRHLLNKIFPMSLVSTVSRWTRIQAVPALMFLSAE